MQRINSESPDSQANNTGIHALYDHKTNRFLAIGEEYDVMLYGLDVFGAMVQLMKQQSNR